MIQPEHSTPARNSILCADKSVEDIFEESIYEQPQCSPVPHAAHAPLVAREGVTSAKDHSSRHRLQSLTESDFYAPEGGMLFHVSWYSSVRACSHAELILRERVVVFKIVQFQIFFSQLAVVVDSSVLEPFVHTYCSPT